jgi:phosphonate transport system substrate-binding protein
MEKRWARVFVGYYILLVLLIAPAKTLAQTTQTLSIKTLSLGVVFQGETAPVAEHFRPLVEYAASKLAPAGEIKSSVIVAASAAQLMQLLEQKRIEFYFESPFPTYIINRSGLARLILRRWKSAMSEYRGVIFASTAAGVSRLEALRGKMIAFEDAGSTSGYFLPKLLLIERGFLLAEKPGLDAKISAREIGYVFAGTEKDVVKLVLDKKVAAGAISSDDYASLEQTSKAGLTVLVESGSLPRHLVSVRRSLSDAIINRLRQILLAMDQDDEGRKILRATDNTTKFDSLPGGEEEFRRKLIELYRPRGRAK